MGGDGMERWVNGLVQPVNNNVTIIFQQIRSFFLIFVKSFVITSPSR